MNFINKNIYENLDLWPQDLDGWGGNDAIFEEMINLSKPTTIVEIGSWKGQSTINMGKCLCKTGLTNSKIYAIDTWLGASEFWTTHKDTPERNLYFKNGYPQIYYQFLSNVVHNNLQDIIIPITNTSLTGLKILKFHGIKPDLVYIDASHEEEDVYADLKLSFPMVEKGIVFGHDYDWCAGVKGAVDRFAHENNLTLESKAAFWFIKKI
jgi:hypothetical protein